MMAEERVNECETPEEYTERIRRMVQYEFARPIHTMWPLEAKTLSLHFGLEDGHPRTVEEVADILGVSVGRVRQIEAKFYFRNKHYAVQKRKMKLREFLD